MKRTAKSLLAMLIVLTLLVAAVPFAMMSTAAVTDAQGNVWTYDQYSKRITSVVPADGVTELTFPTELLGTTIEGVYRDFKDSDLKGVTSIIIPDGYKTIDVNSFMNFTTLEKIQIADSVNFIGASAFEGCTSLTSFRFPNGVTNCESHYILKNCTSLISVDLNNLTRLLDTNLNGCTALKYLYVNNNGCKFKGADDNYIGDPTQGVTIVLGENVTSISGNTFTKMYINEVVWNSNTFTFSASSAWFNDCVFVGGSISAGNNNLKRQFLSNSTSATAANAQVRTVDGKFDIYFGEDATYSGYPDHPFLSMKNWNAADEINLYYEGAETLGVEKYIFYVDGGQKLTPTINVHTNASAYQYRYNRVNFDPYSPNGLSAVFVGKDKAVIEYRDSFEYSLDRINWQTSNAFSNLTADTSYSVYYRVAQASSVSGVVNFKTIGEDDYVVAPVSDDQLFSGWSVGSKGQYTANFVNKDVLAPRFQLASQTTVDSESTNIRLLSTVDSLDYDNVGYDIAIDGDEYSFQTRTVYSSVYAVDSTGKRNLYTAGQVGVQDVSNYIFCLEIRNIPKGFFDKKITVKPFWTVDGIKVYGESRKVAVYGYLNNSIKVLAIGNSFSQDAYKYLYDILKANGYEDVVIGNAYAAGCDLKTHLSKINYNDEGYTYYKYDNGVNTSESASMSEMIADEDWQIVTLQQASGSSGISDTYQPHLSALIDYIKLNRTVKDGKIAWHMTWAYKSDSTHAEFPNYDSDQMTMYNAIVGAVNSQIDTNDDIDFVIPAGTTIQNARTVIGDTLTRDGYHLNSLGSYLVGYTWLAAINGRPLTELEFFADDVQLTPAERELVVKYVNSALEDPYNVTDCNS